MHSPLLMPRTEASPRPPREPARRERPHDAEPFARILAEVDPEKGAEPATSSPPAEGADAAAESDPWAAPHTTGPVLAPVLQPISQTMPLYPTVLLSSTAAPEQSSASKNLEQLLPADVHIRLREAPAAASAVEATSLSKTAPTQASEPGFTQAMIGVVREVADRNDKPVPDGDELAGWLSSPKVEAALTIEPAGDAPTVAEVEAPTLPEVAVPVPQQLRLEIQDSGGRWELDVLRSGAEVHIEVGGDAELKKILHGATRELEQRLGMHGDTLGSVQWRPISASSSTQNDRMESGDPRSGQQGQAQQDTPQRHTPPPQKPDTEAETHDTNHHRGLIHRIL